MEKIDDNHWTYQVDEFNLYSDFCVSDPRDAKVDVGCG